MKTIVLAYVLISLSLSITGCAVPALLGVKSYQSGDTRVEFITGVDFGFGMNGVDKVDNNRGISPEGGMSTRGKAIQATKY
jgi:hypothetical protein